MKLPKEFSLVNFHNHWVPMRPIRRHLRYLQNPANMIMETNREGCRNPPAFQSRPCRSVPYNTYLATYGAVALEAGPGSLLADVQDDSAESVAIQEARLRKASRMAPASMFSINDRYSYSLKVQSCSGQAFLVTQT